MTRFGLLAAVLTLGLAGCSLGTNSTDQKLACYDTGSGVKCVQSSLLPAGATPICEDADGDTNDVSSESSADGPSAEDDDVSASSDAADGDESDSAESDGDDGDDECGAVGDSDSEDSDDVDGTSESSDTDDDGVADTDDCDCTTQPPPDGGGDGGTPIPRVLRLQRAAMSTLSR